MDNILKGIGKDRMEALDLLAARQGFGSQQAPRKNNAIIDYWGEYERSLGGVGANEGSGEDAGFLESAIKGAKAQAAGGLGGQVDFMTTMLGTDKVNYFDDIANKNQRKRNYAWQDIVDDPMQYLSDPQGAAYDIGGGLGSSGLFLAEGLALAAALPASVTTGVAGAIGTTAARLGLPKVASLMGTPAGKALVANLISTPLEAISAGGSTANKAQGTPNEKRMAALTDAGINTILLGFSNAVESIGLGGIIAEAGGKNAFAKTMKGVIADTFQNAWEEGAQESSSEYALGEIDSLANIPNPLAWSDQAKSSALVGGLTGGVQGGIMTAGGDWINKQFDDASTKAEDFDDETLEAATHQTKEHNPIIDQADNMLAEAFGKDYAAGIDFDEVAISENLRAKETAEREAEMSNLLREMYGVAPFGAVDPMTDNEVAKVLDAPTPSGKWRGTRKGRTLIPSRTQAQAPFIGEYSHSTLETVKTMTDEQLRNEGVKVQPYSDKDLYKQAVISELTSRGLEMGDNFRMEKEANISTRQASDIDILGRILNKADSPAVSSVFDNIVERYAGNSRQFKKDYFAAVNAVKSAFSSGKLSRPQAENRLANLKLLYNKFVNDEKDGDTIHQAVQPKRIENIVDNARKKQAARNDEMKRIGKALNNNRVRLLAENNTPTKVQIAPRIKNAILEARNIREAKAEQARKDKVFADMKTEAISYIHEAYKDNVTQGVETELEAAKEGRKELFAGIVEELKNGMGKGVTRQYVDKVTGEIADVSDLKGKEETKLNSASYDREWYSNNDPWYQNWYKQNGRKPNAKELNEIAENIYLGNDEYKSNIIPDDGSQEAGEAFAQNRANVEYFDNLINIYEGLKKEGVPSVVSEEVEITGDGENNQNAENQIQNVELEESGETQREGSAQQTEVTTNTLENTPKSDAGKEKEAAPEESVVREEKAADTQSFNDLEDTAAEMLGHYSNAINQFKRSSKENRERIKSIIKQSIKSWQKYHKDYKKIKTEESKLEAIDALDDIQHAFVEEYGRHEIAMDGRIVDTLQGYIDSVRDDFYGEQIEEEAEIAPAKVSSEKPETIENFGATFNLNKEMNGIEIKFSGKPSDSLRLEMKNAGYRWSMKQHFWYAKQTEKSLAFAEKLGYQRESVAEGEEKENLYRNGRYSIEINEKKNSIDVTMHREAFAEPIDYVNAQQSMVRAGYRWNTPSQKWRARYDDANARNWAKQAGFKFEDEVTAKIFKDNPEALLNSDRISKLSNSEQKLVNDIFEGKNPKIKSMGVSEDVGNNTRIQNVSKGTSPERLSANEEGGNAGSIRREENRGSERPLRSDKARTDGATSVTEDKQSDRGDTLGKRDRGSSEGADKRNVVREDLKDDVSVKEELAPSQKKEAKANETAGHNFTITDEDNIGSGGAKTKYKDNVAAIKLLKKIESEGRLATPSEQKVLARYVGWGGLAPAFNTYGTGSANWSDERKELQELLTSEEYAAARASTNNAHYTSPLVVKAVWDIVERLGFKRGRVLEPSMGIGNFFGMMPENMRDKSSLNGVELDNLTGRIAKQLYQKANIEIAGYETTKYPNGFFDLAISNVPFGNYKLHDPAYDKYRFNIHNYFFAKTIDQVREGGLVCFITSTGTMQSGDDSMRLRNILRTKADFIGAIRLPDTAFRENAGTDVTTDLIVLQKRKEGAAAGKHNNEWLNTTDSEILGKYSRMPLPINEYYHKNPDMLIGKTIEDTLYGGRIAQDGTGVDIEAELKERIEKFPKNIYKPKTSERNNNSIESAKTFLAPAKTRQGAFVIHEDGKVYKNDNGNMVELGSSEQKKAKAYVGLRDATKEILNAQISPEITEEELVKLRRKLNSVYDEFVSEHGHIGADKNARALSSDPDYGIVTSIEDYKYDKKTKKETVSKRAIFERRTVNPIVQADKADSPADALAMSLANTGGVDVDYIAKLLNKKKPEVLKSLDGLIYENPLTNGFETADEYLSGNVREKLEYAKWAAAENSRFAKNIEALENVQPADLIPEEISVNLGTPWIPSNDIVNFANYMLETGFAPLTVSYNSTIGSWAVSWDNDWRARNAKDSVNSRTKWGTHRRDFADILEDALNMRSPVVYDTLEDGKRRVNQDETTKAQAKIKEVQDEFKKWVWTDKERAERLAAYYNRNYNNWRLREYDGSHLTFPGYSTLEPSLKPHQKAGVWRIMQGYNTLLAHCVGAGKTWTMQTAAMEMKRLGIANKSMFVIPNHMLKQFENEFRRIYPNAKLLTISSETLPDVTVPNSKKLSKEELEKRRTAKNAQRQNILGRIATEDWDGIIISHNMFKRIPMSPEAYNRFYEEQIEEMRNAIIELSVTGDKRNRSNNRLVKDLEKRAKNLEEKLKRNMNEESKDIVIPFEQLGIDQIFVDEADMFKNLYFTTKMNRIAGISNTNSQRSTDMFMKTQYLTKLNNGRGVVFATGTPISNTMAEMFTMLRYLDAANLREKNMSFFDNWAANFAVKETTVERSPDGQGYRQTEKFTSFTNMPELIKMFRKVADVKTQEDLNLDIPKLKNNKPTVIEVEPNDALRNFIKYEIRDRAKAIHDRAVDPTEDNMLKLTSDLRKASLDIRLVDSSVPAQIADGKITAVADNVFKKYNETKDIKGVQLVFCDLSTPKGASDKIVESDNEMDSTPEVAEENINITAYEEIKKKLVKSGVPSQEIAFIHDVKTKERKEALFAKVRSGEVRVLIGSTEKMGAGTNIQDRLVALHHIDAPWRPRDIEQREGRILRQGNMNKEVEIFTYVTKDSFDANMWEKLKNKATMINQAMSNNLSNRIIEDMDATVLSFAEVEALASGNPLMAERTMIMAELNKYETLYASYRKEKARLENRAGYLPKAIERAKEANSNANKDIKQREDISGDNFSITIGRKTYDNRTDAKTPFDRLVKGFNNEVGAVIGSIGGFELKLRLIKAGNTFTYAGRTYVAENNTVRAEVVGKNTYGCEAKLGSVEYAVMHAPDKEATNSENVIQSLQNELKAVQKELKAPFQYEEKYQTLRKRAEEIEEIFANGEVNDEQKTKYSLTNEEDSRSIEEIVTEISDAIGDDVKKVEPYGKRSILVTLLNNKRVVVKIEDEIILTPEEMSQAKKDHGFDDDADGIIHGYWEKVTSDDIDGILSISRKSTKGTAYHEVLHMAMDLALTQRERNALWKDAEKEAKATGVETEEVIAERYRKWVLARKSGGGTAFGKLLQKMQDFWHQMKALLTGVENAYNVMRKLESAEVWTRNGKRVVGKKGRKLLIAYHGSPNKFDKFSKDYIGTGEGAQAHGWGLYFAEEKKVAEGYRSKLIKGYYDADEIPITLVVDGVTYYTDDGMWENKTSKEWVEMESAREIFLTKLAQNEGNLQYTIKELDAERAAFNEDETKGYTDNELEEAYQMAKVAKDVSYSREVSEGSLHTVDIPEVNVMLDEEKRFNEQPEVVREAIMSIFDGNENPHYSDVFDVRTKGETIYEIISDTVGGDKEASETLNSLGVKGITYNGMIDGRCYVVFDDEAIKILGDSKTAGKKKALVTNNAITGETRVPVVDVTNLPKLDTSIGAVKAAIARNLVGKTFRIIGSNGIGRVANMTDGRHLVGSSQKMQRHYAIRKQAMSAIEEVLNNAVYIEKHTDTRHGTASKYIELYAVVKNKNDLTRFRIVAKEGDKNAGEYEVKDAKFYDIIKDGAVTANMFKNILPAQRSKDLQGQVAQNVPSAISVAELLTGVKDADGKPYVKADGSLAYEASAKKYSFAHSKKMTLEEKVRRATVSSNPQSLTDEIKKNGIKGYLKAKKDEFYKDWIDKNDSLHGLDDAVKLGLGRELKGSEKIYDKVQDLPARAAGMAEALLEGNGQNVAAINRRLQNKKLEWNVTLPMILKQIEAKVMDKAAPDYLKKYGYKNWIDAFGSYLTWRRMVEMSRVHDEAFSEEVEKYNERVALKEKWVRDGKKGEAPKVGKKPVYKPYKLPYDFTISELEMLINQAPEQFKKAAKMYYLLNDNVLTILEDAGIISEDVHELLNKKYKEYCPLMRDFSDTAAADMFFSGLSNGGRGIGNVSSTLKSISLEGSERGVINPLESTVKAVAIAMNRAERNKVAQHAVEMAQKAGAKDIIWEYDVPKGSNPVADPKNCVFTVMYDGKKIAYQTRQELYAPIVGYNLPAVGMFLGVAKNAARTLRAGATMSPSFMVRNVLRDTIFAGISSKNGFTPLIDTLRGAIALLKDEKLRAEFETAGVTSFNFYNNPDKIYKSLVELNGGKQLSLAHPIELVKAIAQYFEDKSAFLESATRMGEFKRAREAGKSIDEAARAARELTLDFSRSGVVGENINQYVPFFNATLQGGDKLYRLFREDFTGTTVKVFKYIVLPSFLLWCLNHDEEWYKELDPKVKMTHWCLPNGIRIPKPQEAGVLFGSGIEAMLDLATGKDPEAMKNLARQIKDGALPNIIPTVLLPLVEWQANYSFFRDGKLVGYREEKLPDELQFKDSTSELSKAIGKGVGLSPIKIDNTVRGYTGTMGIFIWQLYDIGSINKEKLPDKKITELPFIRDFFVNDYNTRRSIDDFYKMAEEANKQHAGYGKKGKPSSVVKGIRAANKKISDLNKDIREITNKNIPSDRKRILIDRKRELQQRIAKNAITRYGRFFD